MNKEVLRFDNITADGSVNSVKNISFHVCAGELICLRDLDGTVSRILEGVLSSEIRPVKGNVYINGKKTDCLKNHKKISVIKADAGFFPYLSVYDNLSLMNKSVKAHKIFSSNDYLKYKGLLEEFGLNVELKKEWRLLDETDKYLLMNVLSVINGCSVMVLCSGAIFQNDQMVKKMKLILKKALESGIGIIDMTGFGDFRDMTTETYELSEGRVTAHYKGGFQEEVLLKTEIDKSIEIKYFDSNPKNTFDEFPHSSVLFMKDICVKGKVNDFSLNITNGEVICIYDRKGFGAVNALGVLKGGSAYCGNIWINGKKSTKNSVYEFAKKGIYFVSKESMSNDNISSLCYEDELTLCVMPRISSGIVVNKNKQAYLSNWCRETYRRLGIQMEQNELWKVIAKLLLVNPKLIIFEYIPEILSNLEKELFISVIGVIHKKCIATLILTNDKDFIRIIDAKKAAV